MQTIKVGNQHIQLDIVDELSSYNFDNARWTSDKLIASSPFRDDKAPSFFVNLDGDYAGTWGDSGAYGDELSSGNFVKLIALLNGITYEDTADMLIDKHGALYTLESGGKFRIESPTISEGVNPIKTIDNPITSAVSPYLIRRGIAPANKIRRNCGRYRIVYRLNRVDAFANCRRLYAKLAPAL